jgi:hypothetical protein
MKKTKRTISILVLMAIFTFSWGASYTPILANEQPPVGPSDGSAEKKTDGKDTKGGDSSSTLIALVIRLLLGV